MVLNAAVQVLREADNLKQKILKFNSGTSMLQDKTLWTTQQQLQKVYQKVLMLDLDYALEKKVEQDLWNIGFKQQIEALQAISKDRKNPLRSEAQPMLSWVLQAAAGFYLCLLHQICSTFKLDLPFRRRASLLGSVEGWEACPVGSTGATGAVAARYACQHCLVHLGDLARYRQQLRVAYTFYRHALAVSVHSGQPYNQLALVAWRRGRRLAAVYWHVRSLMVRAPFPPAPANLARTLAAAASRDVKEAPAMPVLPGLSPKTTSAHVAAERLDSHTYVNELVRVLHYLHSTEQLEAAAELVNTLNTALSPLIATDGFDSMTLIKMACVIIWVVQSSREDFSVELSALSETEVAAAALATELASGVLLALLLPAYTAPRPPPKAMPALKVWLSWLTAGSGARAARALAAPRPQLWPALAHVLNALAAHAHELTQSDYDLVPLPEDEELHGFVPLEESFKGLKFTNQSGFDGTALPEFEPSDIDGSSGISELSLVGEPELEAKVRARRIVRLGQRLAEQHPEHITCVTKEDGLVEWTASTLGGEQLNKALEPLRLVTVDSTPDAPSSAPDSSNTSPDPLSDSAPDSTRELRTPPPPLIISEADFREKEGFVLDATSTSPNEPPGTSQKPTVREKRVGILKPQGSLERAREERALANTQEEPEVEGDDGNKSEDKKEVRKARVNIAMAAIMRKQEETNKQVKFVTPPPTPDSTTESADPTPKDEKAKVIQPKAIKSLANLPIGRKTGGILSLKDKSAGYPHLVNADPEPKKPEKEEKKDSKSSQVNNQNSQTYQPKRQEHIPTWPNTPMPTFNEAPRMNFQKNYGIQNAGISYNPNYQAPTNNQGIRLPVVNPKEIDVRTAALQKQSARQDMFPDGHKFGNHGYQMSGDKKNFLNDLPPRFANQYRYWQTAQDNQFNDNKFRDENMKPSVNFSVPPPAQNWATPQSDNFQQAPPWWKLDSTNFAAPNYPAPINLPNYYRPMANVANPYQNVPFNQIQGQNVSNIGQNKPENLGASYLQQAIGQSQLQTLQNLVTSPNFNSNLTNYGPYAAPVSYDSSMYPQFNKLTYPPLSVNMDKPAPQAPKELDTLSFGPNILDMQQQRNVSFNEYQDGVRKPDEAEKQSGGDGSGVDGMGGAGLGGGANIRGGGANAEYSLFSAAPAAAWPRPLPHQSLWSGPGPSPLERLLEQQKQMKQPPQPQ